MRARGRVLLSEIIDRCNERGLHETEIRAAEHNLYLRLNPQCTDLGLEFDFLNLVQMSKLAAVFRSQWGDGSKRRTETDESKNCECDTLVRIHGGVRWGHLKEFEIISFLIQFHHSGISIP